MPQPCSSTQLHADIENKSTSFDQPIQFKRSEQIYLTGFFTFLCLTSNFSLLNNKRWQIEELKNISGQLVITNLIDISSNPTMSQTELTINEYELEIGYYKFTIEVKFLNGLFDSAFTYVQVVSTGLLILATENGRNEIQRGYQQNLVLDPVKYSIDYDKSILFSELEFKYLCRIIYPSNKNFSYPSINASFVDLITLKNNTQILMELEANNQSCFSSNGNYF